MNNSLIMAGGSIVAGGVYAIKSQSGEMKRVGRLGGVLCLFSTPDDPDATSERDFFDEGTDFKFVEGMETPIYFHHGLDPETSVKQIGVGTLHRTERGIEIKAELDLDDVDGRACYHRAKKGELGWSSGTAAHLVVREQIAAKSGAISHHITHWPLGLDASLTPNPAEPRNVALAIKTLIEVGMGGCEIIDVPEAVAEEVEVLCEALEESHLREMRALQMTWLSRQLIESQMDYLRELHQRAGL